MADAPLPIDRINRAKIVATIGPASDSDDLIRRLIIAGVSVFRLNFSHGSFDEHERRLEIVRRVARSLGRPVAVLGDRKRRERYQIRAVRHIRLEQSEPLASAGGQLLVEGENGTSLRLLLSEPVIRGMLDGV